MNQRKGAGLAQQIPSAVAAVVLLVELLNGWHGIGHAQMLAPVLGRNHRVRNEFLGELDSVVGKPLGAQVQADGATAFGNSAKLRRVVFSLAILGDARFVVHAKLNPVDPRT